MLCRSCHTQNPPGVRYCQHCGQQLWTTQELKVIQAAMASRMARTFPPEMLRSVRRGPFALLFTLTSGCLFRAFLILLILGAGLSYFLFGEGLFGRAPVLHVSSPGGVVFVVAWSPDGTRIAAGNADQTVRVWDAQSGRQLLVHQGYMPQGPENLAWSPDSKRIASVDHDQNVQIWDATSGQVQQTLHQVRPQAALAWSPDGTRLAVIDSPIVPMVQIFDVRSGKVMVSDHQDTSSMTSVAWSPDGKWLALGSDDGVHLWPADGKGTSRIYTGHHFPVNFLAWSPDSTHMVSIGTSFRGGADEIQVWDVASLHLSYAYPTAFITDLTVKAVGWSSDGKHIAISTTNNNFQVWDAGTGHHLQTYGTGDEQILTLAWSPDSTRIGAGTEKTISVYRPQTTFIGQAAPYELLGVGVFAGVLILLTLMGLLGKRRPPGRIRSVLVLVFIIGALTAVLMALMITMGVNPLFWDTHSWNA